MPGWRHSVALVLCSAVGTLTACAPKRIALPTGDGTPYPDAVQAYQQAVQDCRGARTIRATLGLSGRAGSTRLRGNVDAGFEAGGKVRLEGRPPLGRPVFILVAAGSEATLLLPRDNRVLRGVRPADIVEALVGLPLGGEELRAVVSGCGFGAVDPTDGRAYEGGWVAVDGGGATTYLRQVDGRWRVVATTRPPMTVHYSAFAGSRPSALRVQSSAASRADVSVQLSDVDINVALEAAVFQVQIPPGAEPLTLEELRRAGPLGDQ